MGTQVPKGPRGRRPIIGLIGAGAISNHILRAARREGFAEIAYLAARNPERVPAANDTKVLPLTSDLTRIDLDLVVEAASAEVVRALAAQVVRTSSLLVFSLTAFADDELYGTVVEACRQNDTCVYIPHGAILGLDGIYDGREVLDDVHISTIKHPSSLGLPAEAAGQQYDGSTRGACRMFARNVNVHAAVALCGVGFDNTRSTVIADPAATCMRHEITAKGDGLDWRISIRSPSAQGAVSGSYTPVSAAATVRRALSRVSREGGIVIA